MTRNDFSILKFSFVVWNILPTGEGALAVADLAALRDAVGVLALNALHAQRHARVLLEPILHGVQHEEALAAVEAILDAVSGAAIRARQLGPTLRADLEALARGARHDLVLVAIQAQELAQILLDRVLPLADLHDEVLLLQLLQRGGPEPGAGGPVLSHSNLI